MAQVMETRPLGRNGPPLDSKAAAVTPSDEEMREIARALRETGARA